MKLTVLLAASLVFAAPALADGRDDQRRGLYGRDLHISVHFPVSFRNEQGGRFEPERLAILSRSGTWAADLPERARNVRRGDHIDLSGVPLIGHVFRERTAPQDAERRGLPVGVVSRVGDTLVLDARAHATPLTNLPLTLTSRLPRRGPLAFDVGVPLFQPVADAVGPGVRVGEGYLVDGRLVLAADGARPPLPF